MRDITNVMGNLETDNKGVTVQASTLGEHRSCPLVPHRSGCPPHPAVDPACVLQLGALEALLEFLRKECNPPVPVARVGIGPIFKKDVTQTGINIEKGVDSNSKVPLAR
eukprot:23144-Eustigmatos_ZCMA.PRE.1